MGNQLQPTHLVRLWRGQAVVIRMFRRSDRTYLILFKHICFPERLHGKYFCSIRLLNQSYLSLACCQRLDLWITSPNAPFPITLTVLKSSSPSLVLLNLKKVDSFLPNDCSWRTLRSSEQCSALNLLSCSVRLRVKSPLPAERGAHLEFRSIACSTAIL